MTLSTQKSHIKACNLIKLKKLKKNHIIHLKNKHQKKEVNMMKYKKNKMKVIMKI